MKSLNKVQIIGRLGADPDVRTTNSDTIVATCSIATTDQWNDRQTGEKKEQTEWHRVVAFGKIAEVIRDYTGKGQQIFVEGKLRTRKWKDRDGNDRYTTELNTENVILLGGGSAAPSQKSAPSSNSQPSQAAAPANRNQNNNQPPKETESFDDGDIFSGEDDGSIHF